MGPLLCQYLSNSSYELGPLVGQRLLRFLSFSFKNMFIYRKIEMQTTFHMKQTLRNASKKALGTSTPFEGKHTIV
jgi:hypothetical protein